MSNSPLVNYTLLSPNCNRPRTQAIDTITIHHTAGVGSVEVIGAGFAPVSRGASANYGIGNDGRIGLYVDEANRAWTSSSAANDHRAVTIEVSNSQVGDPWPVSEKAYAALIELVADICKRNGIPKLVWSENKADRVGHKNGCNMTVHQDFAATACPGPYLMGKMGEIAEKVNQKLNEEDDDMNYYKTLEEVPSYYKAAVTKAVDAGALQGDKGVLNASEDLCRMLTVLDRLGKLG